MPLVVTAAVVAYAIAVVYVPQTHGAMSTDGSVSTAAHAADLVAGLGLLAAGVFALTELRARRIGLLACLAGVVWFAPDWDGWDAGPGLVRTLGAAAAPLFLALVFHLVTASAGRTRSAVIRGAVRAVYAIAAGMSLAVVLLRNPFLDPYCWRSCDANPLLLVSGVGTTRAVSHAAIGVEIALGLAVVALAAARAVRRLADLPMLIPAVIAGIAAVAHAGTVWENPLEGQHTGALQALYLVSACAIGALAVGTSWCVLRLRRTRDAVDRLASELAESPPPGGLQRALADALGDPVLTVHYWLPDAMSFVDEEGRPSPPPGPGSGRAVTSITRGGTPVAVVSSDPALLDGTDLENRIGSATRLAVENERLRAEVLARLAAVRDSRARIVGAADATRRQLERNLHDGAQQRLLALSYQLRLAHMEAVAEGDDDLAALLDTARDDAAAALEDLRHLAQGIYPAVLTEAGLEVALATLAETAALPVELVATSLSRLPATVETTAYAAIAEAIDDASLRGATFVTVSASREDDRLVIEVGDDGRERTAPLIEVDDRVGAIGGSADTGPTSLRAVLPCA